MEIFSEHFIKFVASNNNIKNNMAEDFNRLKVLLAEQKKSNKWLSEQLNVGQATI